MKEAEKLQSGATFLFSPRRTNLFCLMTECVIEKIVLLSEDDKG